MFIDVVGGLIMIVVLLLLLAMLIGFASWFIPEFLDNLTKCKDAWEDFRGNNDR